MPKPRAKHCFTFQPLIRLHPAWAGRIVMTCKSHTDRLTRIHRKLLCSEKSKRATAFLNKSITGFSLQIDHHPCMAIQDLWELSTTAKLMGTLRPHIGMDVILTESYLPPKVVRGAVAEIVKSYAHEDPWGFMFGYSKILIFHLKYVQILSKCKYFIGNMCKCVPADPKCQYVIQNICKCVPADPKCQYSIWNMCKLLNGYGKLCSRIWRHCVLHKNINISFEKH